MRRQRQREPEPEPEEWRPIPGFPGYEASSLGQIRSVDRELEDGRMVRGRVLRPRKTGKRGLYRGVELPGGVQRKVSRLVLLAFAGEPPNPRDDARHLDDVKTNDRFSNLAWGSRRENMADARRNGLLGRRKKTP